MASIIPTILAKNKREFMRRLRILLPVANHLQADFMDGRFVRAKSVQAGWLPDMRVYKRTHDATFEAHLMVRHPQRWIKRIKRKGFTKLIFHIEVVTEQQARRLIRLVRGEGLEPMIAINPATSIERLAPFVDDVGFLFMGINPGKEHQHLMPSVYNKIRSFKRRFPRTYVQVDGGVSHRTASRLVLAGADKLNSGSYVSAALDPKAAKQTLEREVRKGLKERRMMR